MRLSRLSLLLGIFFLSAKVWSQEIDYKPDTNFHFKPALFDTTLFEWYEIKGVYHDKLIVNTAIDNDIHTLLVSSEGQLLYDFKAEYRLPRNYQNDNGFWVYKLADKGMSKNKLAVGFFDVAALKMNERHFDLGGTTLSSYTSNEASVLGDLFKTRLDNFDRVLINLKDNWVKRVPNTFGNCDAVFDNKSDKIRLIGQMPENRDSCALYEFSKGQEIKTDAKPIWIKKLTDLGISKDSYYKRFYCDGSNSFYFPGEFIDSITLAARYDLDGNLTSRFQIPHTIRQGNIYDFNLNANVQYLNGAWYLLDEEHGYNYMQPDNGEARDLKFESGFKLPTLSMASQKGFYLNYQNKLVHVAEGRVNVDKLNYAITKFKKTMPLRAIYTEARGSYWVKYAGSNRVTWVRYKGIQEIMRTSDSLSLGYDPELMFNNSIWLKQGLIQDKSGKDQRRWAQYDSDNNYKLIKEEELFGEGRLLHFDPYRQQFYVLSDSLRRYHADFSLDKRFRSEVPVSEVGSVLVNEQGNVYIGNPQYPLWPRDMQPNTYKMDANGKLIWKDRIRELRNAVFIGLGSADPDNFLPMLALDDMILWGSWSCSEGCYINANHSMNEKDEKVQLPYMTENPASIHDVGYVFKSRYGLTLKNHNTFMRYDALNGTFKNDIGRLFYGNPKFWHSDILPDSSVLAILEGRLYKYKENKRFDEQGPLATESHDRDIRVYPNPTIGRRIYIESKYGIDRIAMVNSLGQKIPIRVEKEVDRHSIPIGLQPSGLYFLQVEDDRNRVNVFRLLVD